MAEVLLSTAGMQQANIHCMHSECLVHCTKCQWWLARVLRTQPSCSTALPHLLVLAVFAYAGLPQGLHLDSYVPQAQHSQVSL